MISTDKQPQPKIPAKVVIITHANQLDIARISILSNKFFEPKILPHGNHILQIQYTIEGDYPLLPTATRQQIEEIIKRENPNIVFLEANLGRPANHKMSFPKEFFEAHKKLFFYLCSTTPECIDDVSYWKKTYKINNICGVNKELPNDELFIKTYQDYCAGGG